MNLLTLVHVRLLSTPSFITVVLHSLPYPLVRHHIPSFVTTSPRSSACGLIRRPCIIAPLVRQHAPSFVSAHPRSSAHILVRQRTPSFVRTRPHSCTTHPRLHMLASACVPTLVCARFCLCTCYKSIISTLKLYFVITFVFHLVMCGLGSGF